MNIQLIGEQIAKFRKAIGMTQEDLGRAVGVSTQAVSRWERGGAPDVGLLPAIADTLRVPIDALFGREGGETLDIKDAVYHYLASLPGEEFFEALVRLIWAGIPSAISKRFGVMDIGPMEHCEVACGGGPASLAKCVIQQDTGLLMGAYAKDLRFMLVLPEPEEGYGRFLADNDQYRGLFAALAAPHALELLLASASVNARFVSAAFLAKRVGIGPEEAERVMEALAQVRVVGKTEMELEDGVVHAWSLERAHVLVPFLLLARYLCQGEEMNHIGGFMRDKPWIRDTGKKGTDRHEA